MNFIQIKFTIKIKSINKKRLIINKLKNFIFSYFHYLYQIFGIFKLFYFDFY